MILLSSSMPLRLGSFCKETLELVLHGSSATQTAQEEELKRRTQEHITRRALDIEEDRIEGDRLGATVWQARSATSASVRR